MTRKNISNAMSAISDKYLIIAMDGMADTVTNNPGEVHKMKSRNIFTFKKVTQIAFAACLILALSITAFAVGSRILMKLQKSGTDISVNYDAVDDAFIGLGTWVPAEVPEGYEIDFVSDPFYGNQVINYRNANGNTIHFEYAKAGQFGETTIKNVISEEDVSIHDCTGKLYHHENGHNLFWTSDLDGIGFWINTDDVSINLVAIAESVERTDTALVPSFSEGVTLALEELGDFTPALVPDTYASVSVTGSPSGDGWYAYVRKSFTDEVNNKSIFLSYETYCAEDGSELTAEEVLATFNVVGTDVTVNGMPGILNKSSSTVYWADVENHLSFMVSADDMQAGELLNLANSVR